MALQTKDKHLIRVIKKMCKYADIDYETFDFKKKAWYSSRIWTEEQQNKFKKWFIETLYKDKKLRDGLYSSLPKNKKKIKEAWSYFNLSYGWRLNEG